MANNIRRLTKHELCTAMANYAAGPVTRSTYREDFTSEYENLDEDWLCGFTFVKMLGEHEALYMVCMHDDEGPNPYEGVCACFAHVKRSEGGGFTFAWGEWPPAM